MKTYLEYKDEKSHKFWKIEVNGNSHIVRYGKVGTDGRESIKEFDSNEEAQKEADKLIKSKEKKGYVRKNEVATVQKQTAQKPTKIRQPLVENPQWKFGYPIEQIALPKGKFMTFDEAHKKYTIEGGQLEHFIKQTYVLDGDVHIKNYEEVQEILNIAQKDDDFTLIIITGNLYFEDCLNAPFSPLMVCGDVYCNEVYAGDENDTTIKGNIYAKNAFIIHGSDTCFEGMKKVYTPYFITNGDDVNRDISLAKGYIGITESADYYGSERGYKIHYKSKDYAKVLAYEALDHNFELDVNAFCKYVASGDNPILEYERTKQEIKADKKRKLSESLADIINKADTVLELEDFGLKEIPNEVFDKTDLEELYIRYNKIKKLPQKLANLQKLRNLNISSNIDIQFDVVGELESLEILNISDIGYHDVKIPNLSRLKKLHTLIIDDGGAHKTLNMENIADLQNLQKLAIDAKFIVSSSPYYVPAIKEIKTLTHIKVTGRKLQKDHKRKIEQDFSHCQVIFDR